MHKRWGQISGSNKNHMGSTMKHGKWGRSGKPVKYLVLLFNTIRCFYFCGIVKKNMLKQLQPLHRDFNHPCTQLATRWC
jgi:hypothetical protein